MTEWNPESVAYVAGLATVPAVIVAGALVVVVARLLLRAVAATVVRIGGDTTDAQRRHLAATTYAARRAVFIGSGDYGVAVFAGLNPKRRRHAHDALLPTFALRDDLFTPTTTRKPPVTTDDRSPCTVRPVFDSLPLPSTVAQVTGVRQGCPTTDCPGDARYAAPGRLHREGCTYPLDAATVAHFTPAPEQSVETPYHGIRPPPDDACPSSSPYTRRPCALPDTRHAHRRTGHESRPYDTPTGSRVTRWASEPCDRERWDAQEAAEPLDEPQDADLRITSHGGSHPGCAIDYPHTHPRSQPGPTPDDDDDLTPNDHRRAVGLPPIIDPPPPSYLTTDGPVPLKCATASTPGRVPDALAPGESMLHMAATCRTCGRVEDTYSPPSNRWMTHFERGWHVEDTGIDVRAWCAACKGLPEFDVRHHDTRVPQFVVQTTRVRAATWQDACSLIPPGHAVIDVPQPAPATPATEAPATLPAAALAGTLRALGAEHGPAELIAATVRMFPSAHADYLAQRDYLGARTMRPLEPMSTDPGRERR